MAQRPKNTKSKAGGRARLKPRAAATTGAAPKGDSGYTPQPAIDDTAARQVAITQPSLGGSYLTAEISRSAVLENLELLRQRISPSTKLCAVVKANCYGHGLQELVGSIAARADMLGVATAHEALEVRRMGYDGELLALFSASAHAQAEGLTDALEELISRNVMVTVVTAEEAQAVARAAQRIPARANVHVKVDTGMGQSGILDKGAPELVAHIRKLRGVELTGLYTHFADADAADKKTTLQQLDRFAQVVNTCGAHVGLTLHTANSAAMIDLPQTHWDMVRPGIAIYGYQPSDQIQTKLPLRPSLRLTGRLMQIKQAQAGSSVGYGLTYTFDKPSRVGLVPVGYADGYLRSLSGKATMRVRGHHVPVRGRVSMDQVTIDLTEVPKAQVGDEVEIISPDPQAPHSIENLARLAGTIPYEITCGLGRRIRRVLVD